MTQLGLFIAGAAAATAVNAAALAGFMYLNNETQDKKWTWQYAAAGAGGALAADAAVIAPVLTGAAALEAFRSRARCTCGASI